MKKKRIRQKNIENPAWHQVVFYGVIYGVTKNRAEKLMLEKPWHLNVEKRVNILLSNFYQQFQVLFGPPLQHQPEHRGGTDPTPYWKGAGSFKP